MEQNRSAAGEGGEGPGPKFAFLGGIGRALSSRNFFIYWVGNLVSVNGVWVNKIALGWLIWKLTEQAIWLGIIGFVSLIPLMFVGPVAGAVADRIGARRVALWALAVGFVVAALMGLLTVSKIITPWSLVGLAALQGILMSFDFPARQTLIPILVDRANLSAAIALNSSTYQVGLFIGPVIGGLVIIWAGIGAAFFFNAFALLWLMGALFMIRMAPEKRRAMRSVDVIRDLVAGFRYAWGLPSLRLLLVLSFTTGFLIRPYAELLPGFADQIFDRGADGLAMLNAAAGLGALTGAAWLALRGRTGGLANILITAGLVASLFLILFPMSGNFPLALALLGLAALCQVCVNICINSLVQNVVDNALRGRIVSLNSSLSGGGAALGALAMGGLAEVLGLRPPIAVMAGVMILFFLVLRPLIRRQMTTLEAEPRPSRK